MQLAAEYVNAHGGVGGRQVEVRLKGAEQREQAPAAVEALADDGVKVVLGSYGSTISQPAAATAARRGLVFWETGAVGELGMQLAPSQPVFRYPTSGVVLGREAVAFVRDRLELGDELRYTVAYVDDVYGRSVGSGASSEIATERPHPRGEASVRPATVDYRRLVDRIAAAKTDVLVVSAYLEDGVAMRKRDRAPRVAAQGEHRDVVELLHDQFGDDARRERGRAVRVGQAGRQRSRRGPSEARGRCGAALGPRDVPEAVQRRVQRLRCSRASPARSALFRHVLPAAKDGSPRAVVRAARAADVPRGGLPDGGGLRFGAPAPTREAISARPRDLGMGCPSQTRGRVAAGARVARDRPAPTDATQARDGRMGRHRDRRVRLRGVRARPTRRAETALRRSRAGAVVPVRLAAVGFSPTRTSRRSRGRASSTS